MRSFHLRLSIIILATLYSSISIAAGQYGCVATDRNNISRQVVYDSSLSDGIYGTLSGQDTYKIDVVDNAGFGNPNDFRIRVVIKCLAVEPGQSGRPSTASSTFEMTAQELDARLDMLLIRTPILCGKIECRAQN